METVEGWVIEVCQDRFSDLLLSYHTGHTYIHQEERYGAFNDIENAKIYTSKKRAVNVMEKLKLKVINWETMEVVPLGVKI